MPAETLAGTLVPRLGRFVKLRWDATRERHVLLGPESVVVLNRTGHDVLELCDGRTVDGIVDELARRYGADDPALGEQVRDYLVRLAERNHVRFEEGP